MNSEVLHVKKRRLREVATNFCSGNERETKDRIGCCGNDRVKWLLKDSVVIDVTKLEASSNTWAHCEKP